MKKLKKDLQTASKSLKALAKKTESLMKAVDKLENAQAAKERKAKTKTTRKAAAKKTKAKTTRKAPAKKKAAALTATDQVIKIIKGSKKGVDAPTLIKKTGFDDKKVRNILMRTSKQRKIKRAGRGIYVAA
ncbi:MAG: hypothetical protein HWN68_03865 [Desulfobacterales bacterium]|nr:hypothetical protein [Desulfobacterales bacterium]